MNREGTKDAKTRNGLVVLVFAYAHGHISGAHINPAVTIGLWAARAIDGLAAIGYIIVQILGGIAAALLYVGLLRPEPATEIVPSVIEL